jgi:hypothetical protein
MLKRALLPLAAVAVLAACSDTSAPNLASQDLESASAATAEVRRGASMPASMSGSMQGTVYVVHGINGLDLGPDETLPVDVSVNGACALTDFQFRDIAGPLMLDEGSYDIKVSLADPTPCGGAVAIDAPGVFLPAGANVSIVAHLAEGGAPTATVFANDLTRNPGRAQLIPRHAADFGLVDIVFDGAVVFEDVPNGAQGVATVRPGQHEVAIAVADTDTRAFEATLVLRPFTMYAAYAVGTPANGTFDVILQALDIRRSNRP